MFYICIGKAIVVALQPIREATTMKKPIKQRRVVVTGMGVVTPLGHDPKVFYNNLLEGVSGISEIDTFNCAEFPTVNHISSELHFQLLHSVVLFSLFCVSRE